MGILRFIIAVLVISMHAPHNGWPYTPHSILPEGEACPWGGLHPLHSFFVLAGFYAWIQLAGGALGGGASILKYYRDRFFRLYPTFIIAIILTLALSFCFPVKENGSNPRWGLDNILPELDTPGKVLLCLPNVTMFGSEIPAWFNLVDGERAEVARPIGDSFPPDQPKQYIWLMWAKLVPPTFALGMMLWFFLLSPMMAAGGRWFVVVAGLLSYFCWRFFGSLFIYDGYFIWVFWLWTFCVGMLAGVAYLRWKDQIIGLLCSQRYTRPAVIAILCGFVVWALSGGWRIPVELYTFLLAGTFPWLAAASQGMKADRYLGGLSYPFYCSLTIGLFLSEIALRNEWIGEADRMYAVMAISLTYSVLMAEFIEKPLAKFRRWVRGEGQAPVSGLSGS